MDVDLSKRQHYRRMLKALRGQLAPRECEELRKRLGFGSGGTFIVEGPLTRPKRECRVIRPTRLPVAERISDCS